MLTHIFAYGTIFLYQKRKVFHVFNHFIWSVMKSIISAAGKVCILILLLLDILDSRRPDKIESPISKIMPFFQVGCLLDIHGSVTSLKLVIGSFIFDVSNNSCKEFVFSIKSIV